MKNEKSLRYIVEEHLSSLKNELLKNGYYGDFVFSYTKENNEPGITCHYLLHRQ